MHAVNSVHFCYPRNSSFKSWEHETLANVKKEFFAYGIDREYAWCDSPEEATIIVWLESNTFKFSDHIRNVETEPLLNRFPEKVFCYNYDDHPAGFIDGVYAQMPHSRFDRGQHRCINLMFQHNELIYDLTDADTQRSPSLLCSFRGSFSHPIRPAMFKVCEGMASPHALQIVDKWYNHSEQEKSDFVQELLDSKFVLCPRGLAPYSNRTGEAMAAGRVPIIIADDSQNFSGIEMERYALWLKEAEIARLPELMLQNESRAGEMGRIARQVWNEKLGRGKRLLNLLNLIMELKENRTAVVDMDYYRARWHSHEFHRAHGWTLRQRLERKVKQTLRQVVRS